MTSFAALKILSITNFIGTFYYLHFFDISCLLIFSCAFFPLLKSFLYKQKSRFDFALNAIERTNLTIRFDMNGNILKVNDNFCKLTEYNESELLKKNHKDLLDKDYRDSEEYILFWDNLRKGINSSGEFRRISKKGKYIWIFANYIPIKDNSGEYKSVLKIASDITLQYNNESEARKKTVYLEHAAKILRHDIHSGINTYIPRGLKSLKRRLNDEVIAEYNLRSPLKMISSGLEHTQKVYKGVYEFTNLVKENSKLSLDNFSLKDILDEYLKNTAYKQQVEIKDLGFGIVNDSLFCTAIDNLIRNGLKYNDSLNKLVKIYRKGDSIFVRDNGRGMNQNDFENFSQPYKRGNQNETGTGLGLNICVSIIEEHKFKIRAKKNKGTIIEIKLK
mgnify:CR=1 FL=1